MAQYSVMSNAPLVDQFQRRISYLRLSVTDRCDLRCSYCMPERQTFLPRAEVLTPNIPEAEALIGAPIRTVADMHDAARQIRKLGPRVVVLKGGHLPPSGSDPDFCVDVFSSAQSDFELRGPRVDTPHTHGTGCTFAAAICAALALGQTIDQAVSGARDYVEGAIRNAPALGRGHGPLNHFWRVY